MGHNNRYDRDRPVTRQEMDESRALHMLGEVVAKQIPLVLWRSSVLELAEVLHATGIELGNGRPVPLGVRRAVLRLANGLRQALDPRTDGEQPAPVTVEPGVPESGRPASQ